MGDQDERARVSLQRLLQLLDRLNVEMVGRLVEHQEVNATSLQQSQAGPVRSPGDSALDGRSAASPRSLNLASSVLASSSARPAAARTTATTGASVANSRLV